MSKKEIFIVILITVTIVLSCINLVSMTGLNRRLDEMQGDLQSLRSEVQSEACWISGVLHEAQDEARWWKPAEIGAEALEQGPAAVKLGCYLKDYRAGSKVHFNYRRQGEAEYTSLEAEEGSSGYFHALLELEFDPRPLWQHTFSRATLHDPENPGSGSITELETDSDPRLEYEYYISVRDGDAIRTGDVESFSLDELSYGYYSSLNSDVNVEEGNIDVFVLEEAFGRPRYTVTRAEVELRTGGGTLKKIPLSRSDRPDELIEWRAGIDIGAGEEYSGLRLVVTYSDGKSFSRQMAQMD